MKTSAVRPLRRIWTAGLIASSCVFAVTLPARTQAQDEVSEAIDKGIEFLLGEVEKEQVPAKHKVGQVALETYALVVAGVAADHPLIEANFEVMRKSGLNHTYTVSCIIFALDAAMSQIELDQYFVTGREPNVVPAANRYRPLLEKAVNALVRIRQGSPGGSWNYGPGGDRYDNSNTQFAVLALGVGAKRRVPIPDEVWLEIAKHFVDGQQEKGPEVKDRIELLPPDERGEEKKNRVKLVDTKRKDGGKTSGEDKKKKKEELPGRTVVVKPVPEAGEFGEEELKVFSRGWAYQNDRRGASWNMTNAGLSSLILAADNLRGKLPADFQNKLNRAIRDGYGWVMQHWNPFAGGGWKYYGIYSLEKVGDLGEVKKFGAHDWYEEVSKHVLGEQRANGSWPGEAEHERINTAFALLVLNRATSLLTRGRASRMVITGPGARRGEDDADDWVYIQSLDRELHLPSLFRMLRLRPNPRLAKFVNLAVQDYPLEKNGKLIPGLIAAHEQLTSPKFKALLSEKLVEIAGVLYDDPGKYHVWYRRWRDVDEAGSLVKKEEIPWLLTVYDHTTQSVPLRKKIIWALTRCQATAAAPLFIADLGHASEVIREAAYIGLTVMPFAGVVPLPRFDAKASSKEREQQLVAVAEWYEKVK